MCLQLEAVKLLVCHQRLYETALLCLYRTAHRDIKHLCATLLFFVLDSHTWRGARPREACGQTVCYILFSSLFSVVDDSVVSEYQETTQEDCCLAIIMCDCLVTCL